MNCIMRKKRESTFEGYEWRVNSQPCDEQSVCGDRWCAAAMLWTETVWTGSVTWKESLAGLRGAMGLSVLQK